MTQSSYKTYIASIVDPLAPSSHDDFVYQFFIYFARFEYAMKRSGYLKGDQKRAEADWDKLGNDLHDNFDWGRTPELKNSINYLTEAKLKKQVVKKGKLDWNPIVQDDSERYSRYILRIVCTVRNNLFHGGKFPSPTGSIAESSRDKELLQHCLVILVECSKHLADLAQQLPVEI